MQRAEVIFRHNLITQDIYVGRSFSQSWRRRSSLAFDQDFAGVEKFFKLGAGDSFEFDVVILLMQCRQKNGVQAFYGLIKI